MRFFSSSFTLGLCPSQPKLPVLGQIRRPGAVGMAGRGTLLLLLLPGLCLGLPLVQEGGDTTDLTIIHINDIHAHFEEMSVTTSRCREAGWRV